MLLLQRSRPCARGLPPGPSDGVLPTGRVGAPLRLLVVVTVLGLGAARPLQAQEPEVPDSVGAAADTTPTAGAAVPDTTRAAPDTTSPGPAVPADSLAATDSTVAADSMVAADVTTPVDSIAPADSAAADSAAAAAADTLERVRSDIAKTRERLEEVKQTLETLPEEDRLARSPRGAVLRAFALPGWGQFYTGHPIRGFLYGGAEVAFATLGVLRQSEVLDLRDEIFQAKLDFVAADQELHPDSAYSKEDTLELYDRFEGTVEGLTLEAELNDKQKSREDFFTYAIFSVLFGAIDAFVSAHLEPFDKAKLGVTPSAGWRIDVRLPLGGAPPNDAPDPRLGPPRSGDASPP
jgi:hypothetical protein